MGELRTVLPYFRPYKMPFIAGVICVVFANAFQMAGPYLIKLAIDGIGNADEPGTNLWIYPALIVGAALIGGAFRFGMRELLNGVSRRMETDLRDDFFRHLLRMDAEFYGSTRTGDLMSRATNDTLAVRMAVGPAIMYSVNTAIGFVLSVSLMMSISSRLTIYVFAPMVILPPIVLYFGKVIHARFEKIQEQFSELSTFVQENLTGVRIVRAYGQEAEQARQFDDQNDAYREANMRLVLRAGAFHPLLMLIAGTGGLLVTWFGAVEVIAGRMTLGDFVAFALYLGMLVWPMIALGWVVNLYQRGAASMGRLNEILNAVPAVRPPEDAVATLASPRGRVVFDDVGFRYPGTERQVLDGVSFVAEPGETIAIVGPTGSGKSTIVSLLTRTYDPTEGRISIDGVGLTRVDPADLRRNVGMVPQDAFLFSDTIERNIGLGLPPESERWTESVRRAADTAQLHDRILDFPDGYDTMLGERGINLSGGQKQRATLARALARKPIVLVLDDALSAVDTHTEAAILAELDDAMAASTAFVISHRVSAVMNADKILVIEDGRIVQEGKHEELIAAEGTYERLLRRQLLEEELTAPAGAGD